MKKSLKVLFAVIVCIVLMCPLFAGCAAGDAEYVEGSFDYEITLVYGVKIEGSFDVNFKEEGSYTVKYTLSLYNKSTKQLAESRYEEKNITVMGRETKNIYIYDYLPNLPTTVNYTVEISNITITKQRSYDNSQDYAIGFGVTAAVLTCGITAFFIITKFREKKD